MKLPSRPLVFFAALASFLVAVPVSASVLLSDTMSRASRTAVPTPAGAQWFSVGPGLTVTYATNELKLTHSTGSGGQLVGYLATTTTNSPTTSSVTLAVGQSLKATFTFSLVGTFGTATGDSAFRFGLFNTGTPPQRISSDITAASASGTFTNYTGYAAMMSRSTSGISIRKRIPNAATNKENLIGTTTTYSTPLASASGQALQSNTDYTGVLTATRTASGIDFSVSITGPGVNAYQLSTTDTASPVVTFDAIAFGWSTSLMQANGGLAVRSLTLEVGAATPPPPPPYTGTDPAKNPDPGRPFIWVRNSEKAGILAKVAANPWAQSVRDGMINRVAGNIASHQADRDAYLRQLPVNWSDPVPKFKTMLNTTPSSEVRSPAVAKFNAGLDAAVLYYLTGDPKYAQCAADILHNVVTTLLPVTPSADTGNGGWIVQNDLLLEARIVGTHLPIMYDFLRTYLETNQVYDVTTGAMVDFDYLKTQSVFRTYYQLVRDRGNNTNNWSALEATCMLNNLLALSDPAERAAALQIYLTTGALRQASLQRDYRNYEEAGNVWPESLQYAGDVVGIRTMHMVLLERYDPSLNLLASYPNYAMSLSRISYLRYPNGELISFGDGHRDAEEEPYFEYELVYQHARARNRPDLVAHFGSAINRGVSEGRLNRSALRSYEALGRHDEPLQLLWFAPEVAEPPVPQVLTTTDRLPFAGIALQRNLSPSSNPFYGLMGFVGGAGHTHSHASGMSMELYGLGQVLGAKSGRAAYLSTEHENYYRLFASNNTVIVNGASRGQGGWEDISINTVGVAAMEPAVGQAPVSPNHSFTTSTFLDDRGSLAEATQQRTLGIIRTSPTTGYYVDIFRSSSSLPNQYHDYIYRNVGDAVALATDTGPLALAGAPGRFSSDIGDAYQQPGWRYFTGTEVSAPTGQAVRADFSATLPAGEVRMSMLMPGSVDREYARVSSPAIVDAPAPYHTRRAPAVVIRKYGNAWNQPFAAVFEPHLGPAGSGTVKAVQALEQGGVVVGLRIESTVAGKNLVQYVLSNPNAEDVYEDAGRGLYFKGRYAVVTDHGDGSGTLYLGEGSKLAFKGNTVVSRSGAKTEASVDFTPGQSPVVKSNQPVDVYLPPTIVAPAAASGRYGEAFSLTVSATGQPAAVLSAVSALPPGLQFDAQTGRLSGVPTAAGDFPVQFVATNLVGSATATTLVSIARAPATVTLLDLVQTYTGQPLSPTVLTMPANLPVQLGFSSGSAPRNAGTYQVTATINSPNYVGSVTGSFEIRRAPAVLSITGLDQSYNGTPRSAVVETAPTGLGVSITYTNSQGDPIVPVWPGDYAITAKVTDANYSGTASAILRLSATAAVLEMANLLGGIDGSVQLIAGRDVLLNGNAWISGDLLVPGTPALQLQGRAICGATLEGPGAVAPGGYSVRLQGNAALRALVRRVDSTPPSIPAAPSASTGTEDYVFSRPGQQVGDFSLMRNLSLSGNADAIAVPPGRYGNISATGRASLVLGVAGATTPQEYSVQSISLTGESSLLVVGPIVLRVDHKVEILGDAEAAAKPGHLRLEVHHGELILDGRSVLFGTIFAPDAKVILRGQAEVHGRIVARELEIHAGAMLADPQLAH